MSREIYKRVAPHLQRVAYDGGVTTNNMQGLFALQRSNEELKDYLKLSFCPELTGIKKRTASGIDYISKGYSANSIGRELGSNLVLNGDFTTTGGNGVTTFLNGEYTFTSGTIGILASKTLYNLQIGQPYRFYYTIKRGTYTGILEIGISTTNNGVVPQNMSITTDYKTFYLDFIAISTTQYINVRFAEVQNLTTVICKDISIIQTNSNDLTQTTDNSQPYLDKIAPTEPYSIKNPNGGSRYMTHPTISFGANDEWSVEVVLNWNGVDAYGDIQLCGGGYRTRISIEYGTVNNFLISNDSDSYVNGQFLANKKQGKIIILTVTRDSIGNLKTYIDNTLVNTHSKTGNFIFSKLFAGWETNKTTKVSIYSHHIFSKALSPNQISERSSILRSIFPEIPSVTIGSQTWAVRNFEAAVTPQGNLIAEMQTNGNVEKITNAADRDFSSDTGWWMKGAGWNVSNGTANHTTTSLGYLEKYSILTIGKSYKILISVISGNVSVLCGNGNVIALTTGTYILYMQCLGSTNLHIASTDSSAIIDNVSVQEIGWSGSQELYDGIYAQTSGTVEQKTYAAVKAASMWRSPNNSESLQAIYGKKYNKFAKKLLSMDIAYYNAANPTSNWGWDVMTEAQGDALIPLGANVNKLSGTNCWNTANGTNITGLSVIGGGVIDANGNYSGLKATEGIWLKDVDSALIFSDNSDAIVKTPCTTEGHSIRLIKV